MGLIQIDPVGWLPDSLKQQIIDSVVTFIADKAEKVLGGEFSQSLKRLRSDAAFQEAVDRGLKEATDRFVREYTIEDEDLVAAIARDPEFWKAESVRQALLEILKQPSVYLAEERMALARSFADVLRQRVDRERVDRAVSFYLHCVAEALWHLEPLRPMYELQMQRLNVEQATEMIQELRGMRADVQNAMLALVQAIGEQQRLLSTLDRQVFTQRYRVDTKSHTQPKVHTVDAERSRLFDLYLKNVIGTTKQLPWGYLPGRFTSQLGIDDVYVLPQFSSREGRRFSIADEWLERELIHQFSQERESRNHRARMPKFKRPSRMSLYEIVQSGANVALECIGEW